MTELFELVMGSEVARTGVVAILGGIGFKIVERFMNSKEYADEHATFRKELRDELDSVRGEVITLREEVDDWREKYYAKMQIGNELREELDALKHEFSEYKLRIAAQQRNTEDDVSK